MQTDHSRQAVDHPTPWNKGKLLGLKTFFKLNEIRAVRIRLQIVHRIRDLALFNLAIDSKLLGCDPVNLRVADVSLGGGVVARAAVVQRKTDQRFHSSSRSRPETP